MAASRVSIALLCYRDAAYIRDALDAALAQTVPCQVVVSNDCSDDGTLDIAREHLAGYDGPHAVSLRRTPRNLGVAGHVNDVLPLLDGDIVVMMAGDDIAFPQRVQTLLQVFEAEPGTMVIGSQVEGMDADSRPAGGGTRAHPARFGMDYFVRAGRLVSLLGASLAFRREVFDRFGPLLGPIEDNALSLRGALLGEGRFIDTPLLRYRRHAGSVSAGVFARDEPREVAFRRRYERTTRFYRGTADDLAHCLAQAPDLPPATRAAAEDVVRMYRIEADAREAILDRPRRDWLNPIWRGLRQPGLRRKSAERALKLLLPRKWFGATR